MTQTNTDMIRNRIPETLPEDMKELLKTPETILKAVRAAKPLFEEASDIPDMIFPTTTDWLIRECGRFSESYAGDMLITWDRIRRTLKDLNNLDRGQMSGPVEFVEAFGIRRHGVDHNGFLISRLKEDITPFSRFTYAERHYRRILALRIFVTPREYPDRTRAYLYGYDITDHMNTLDEEDV